MTRQEITTEKVAKPVGPFSTAARRDGFIFLSGQVAQARRQAR